MEKGTRREVSVYVEAVPEKVYDVVTDVTRMGEWSPETTGAVWIDGATGPAVGARFKGANKHGWARWSTKPTVVTAEPGTAFAFDVGGLTLWSYRMEPEGSGTRLSESFEMLKDLPRVYGIVDKYVMRIDDRAADLERAMQQTVERIKRAVEGTAA
ncbi:MAG: SRPBCC family protein [Acidimicrobiia bacterium]